MKTLEYAEFSDEHLELAKNLHALYDVQQNSACSPVMIRADKKSLLFTVNIGDKNLDRVAYERGGNMYRIIIEKVN